MALVERPLAVAEAKEEERMPKRLAVEVMKAYERGDPNRKERLREYYQALSQEADAFCLWCGANGMGDKEIYRMLQPEMIKGIEKLFNKEVTDGDGEVA